jgi:hypothetical protein
MGAPKIRSRAYGDLSRFRSSVVRLHAGDSSAGQIENPNPADKVATDSLDTIARMQNQERPAAPKKARGEGKGLTEFTQGREGFATHLLQLVAESACMHERFLSITRDESVSKSIRSKLLSNGTWTNKARTRNWETKEGHRVKREMNGKVSSLRRPREDKLRRVDEGTPSMNQ